MLSEMFLNRHACPVCEAFTTWIAYPNMTRSVGFDRKPGTRLVRRVSLNVAVGAAARGYVFGISTDHEKLSNNRVCTVFPCDGNRKKNRPVRYTTVYGVETCV